MSEPKSVWARARALKKDLKDLQNDAYAEGEAEVYNVVKDARRAFEHPNFVNYEAENHNR